MDIKINDILQFCAGSNKVRILVTHADHDIYGKTLDAFGSFPVGKFMCFSKHVLNQMVLDGVLIKIGQRAKGIGYT